MAVKHMLVVLGATLILGACGVSSKEVSTNEITGEVTAISCEEESGFRYHREYTTLTIDEKYGFEAPSTYCNKVKVGVTVTIEYDAEMWARSIRYGNPNEEVTQ